MRKMKSYLPRFFEMKAKMRGWLIAFIAVVLVSAWTLAGAVAFPSSASEEAHYEGSITYEQVWINNAKLLEVTQRLVLGDLAALGIPLAGHYIDARTATIHVGLTQIKDGYTNPIKAIANEVAGVNLEFFEAKYTYAELRGMQRKIDDAFREDEALKKDEKGIPLLTVTGVDVKENELTVGLRELKPHYMEAIRKIVGTEVPIEWIEGVVPVASGKRERHRPLIGGIQLWTFTESTLGFRATRTDGTVGFVMTGHTGWEGEAVWQPSRVWGNYVGVISVNPRINRESDAAFVPTTDVAPVIWLNRRIGVWLPSAHTPPGTQVRMEGQRSCGTVGVVHRTGVNVWSRPYHEVLENQVLATFWSAPGDSGAPVFAYTLMRAFDPEVKLFGILWGGPIVVGGVTVSTYSPVEGIMDDLGLGWGSQ
jgi:hypothetical protein